MNQPSKSYNSIPHSSSRPIDCHSSSCHDDHDEHTPLLRQRSTQSLSSTYDEQPLPKLEENHSPRYHLSLAGFIEQASLSVYLENKGSVARDHLANERTYLAWLRTSLSLISVGVALTQLFRLDKKSPSKHGSSGGLDELLRSGRFVGLMFVVLGILFVLFAISRYFHAQQAMIKGSFPASRGIVLLASSGVTIAVIILFIIIIR